MPPLSIKNQLILIVGLGSIGRRHLQNLRSLGYSNFLSYRTHKGAISDAELGDCPVVHDLDEALRHHPTIAIICNPTALHLAVSMSAARAGCHLFIEKPLAHDLEECEELRALTQKQQLITMMGCQFRFHPLLTSLSKQIKHGRIGTILGARAEWGEYLPAWHPSEDYRRSYSARRDLGGGSLLTLIHPFDYLYWLFGKVKRVRASVRRIDCLETDVDDDLAEVTLEFSSRVIGQIHLDYIQRPAVHRLRLLGDEGTAEWDYHKGTLCWETVDGQVDVEQVPIGFERNNMFLDEMRHFLECVEQRKQTRVPLEDGIAALDIALRAKQSALEDRCA